MIFTAWTPDALGLGQPAHATHTVNMEKRAVPRKYLIDVQKRSELRRDEVRVSAQPPQGIRYALHYSFGGSTRVFFGSFETSFMPGPEAMISTSL